MKKIIINTCLAIALLTGATSCGDYGYDFEDGYQEGSESGEDPNEKDLDYIDKSMIDRARVYPGLVGSTVKREKDLLITMDFKFKYVKASDLKVSNAPQPIFSTGLYAPAGENIKIVVPAGVIGLTAQLGAHMDDLTGKDPLRREPVIYTVKELFPGENYVRNNFGGIIWIHAAVNINQPVNLQFTNAVKTTDFVLGETTDQGKWLEAVLANDVPWLELRGKRTIFTVPRSLVIQYRNDLNVAEALETWDKIYEQDFYTWMGLTKDNSDVKNSWPELPERGVLDIQPSAGYAHSGSPWVAQQDRHWFMQFSNADYFLKSTTEGAWGAYHEIGHNYQMGRAWSWSALGETTNNLFVFKGAKRLGIPTLAAHGAVTEDIPKALAFAARNAAKNFGDAGNSAFFRLTPFLQIFNKVKGKNGEDGWDFMPYIYSNARNSIYSFSLDAAKIDFFYRTLCAFTGQDYARFMDAWGIAVSTSAKREMRLTYPPLNKTIWTYDPLTHTGGDAPLDPKYDLIGSDFVWTSNQSTATNESTGKIDAINDGNPATYWHTCYSGCSTTLPTYVDLDMKSPQAIRGVYYQNRQGNTYRRAANVWTKASESAAWVKQGELLLASSGSDPERNSRKEFKFSTVMDVRYIRFEFAENNYSSQVHTAIAEAGAFYDPN